jgi:hypothetical protein
MTTTNPRRGGLPTNLPIQSRMRTALDAAEFAARNGRPDAVIQHMCPECGAVRPALDWCTLCQGTGSVPDGVLTAYTADWNARVRNGNADGSDAA